MQNEENQIVDLYIPRKCSATNKLITAKDAASVQIDIAEVRHFFFLIHSMIQVDANGKATGKKKTFALAGFIRQRGEADACLNRLFKDNDLLSFAK